MNMTKRITGLLAALLLCVSSVLVPVHAEEGNAEFDQFMEDLFIEQMEADFMTMHFTLADYKAAGVEKPERIIGKVSMEDYADSVEYAQGMLDRLQKFDYASLSDIQKHDYDTVKFDLENEIALN